MSANKVLAAIPAEGWIAIGAVVLIGGWIAVRGVKGFAADIGSGAVSLANAGAGAMVQDTSQIFGIPNTDAQLCTLARANGETMNVSKYCSASEFVDYLWTGK